MVPPPGYLGEIGVGYLSVALASRPSSFGCLGARWTRCHDLIVYADQYSDDRKADRG